MTIRLSLAFALLLGFSVSLFARDVYVDNHFGDDTNDGSREQVTSAGSGPTRTISRALREAQKGDRVVIANHGDPYRESITLQGGRHSGTSYRPFVIIGQGAVIDGTVETDDHEWEGFRRDVVRFRPPQVAFQTLFLGNDPAQRAKMDVRGVMQLQPKEWTLLEGFIYFRVEKDRLPSFYAPRYGGERVGMTLYDIHDVQIYDLVVQGFQLDGINAHDNARNVTLTNVAASFNGRSGISVGGSSRVNLVSCAGTGNGVAQLRTEGFCKVTVERCQFDEASALPIDQREGGRVGTPER
jgi:hypothetical protein